MRILFSAFVVEGALHEKWTCTLFSVQPLCALCLCGSSLLRKNNHRDTEHTEVAQRRSRIETFVQSRINRDSLVTKGTSTNVFLITCAWFAALRFEPGRAYLPEKRECDWMRTNQVDLA